MLWKIIPLILSQTKLISQLFCVYATWPYILETKHTCQQLSCGYCTKPVSTSREKSLNRVIRNTADHSRCVCITVSSRYYDDLVLCCGYTLPSTSKKAMILCRKIVIGCQSFFKQNYITTQHIKDSVVLVIANLNCMTHTWRWTNPEASL